MGKGWNGNWQGKNRSTKRNTFSNATLSITNPKQITLELNPSLWHKKTPNYRLSCNMTQRVLRIQFLDDLKTLYCALLRFVKSLHKSR